MTNQVDLSGKTGKRTKIKHSFAAERDEGGKMSIDVVKVAEVIAKCETIYYRDSDHEERVIVASPECFELDTHEAKLVGVREVEK